MENLFLTSVADVQIFDNTTGDIIVNGKTELNTSMTQAIQSTAIYGGKGSQKLFEYNYQKELTFSVEDATFNMAYLAMQNGTTVSKQLRDFYVSKSIVFDATGTYTLESAPLGVVRISVEDGGWIIAPLTGGNVITDINLADKEAVVVYQYKKNMDTLVIDAKSFPKAVKMVLNVDIMSNNGKEGELQIVVPKFKPDGALELGMTHDGVASSALQGSALSHAGVLAELNIDYIDQALIPLTGIVVATPEVVLDSAITGDSFTAIVKGNRGVTYGDIILDNATLTWTSNDLSIVTVDANGVITIEPTAATGDDTYVRVTDASGLFKDVIVIEII